MQTLEAVAAAAVSVVKQEYSLIEMLQFQPVTQYRRASQGNMDHFLISVLRQDTASLFLGQREQPLPSLDRSCCCVRTEPQQI